MRIHIASAVAVIVLASFLACSKDSSNPVTPPPTRDHFKVVQMRDNVFSPKDLVISVGDTVEWVNVGSNDHTSTSGPGCTGNGLWNSGSLSNGQTFTAIFDSGHINQTGALPYFCIFHCAINMKGTVTVNP